MFDDVEIILSLIEMMRPDNNPVKDYLIPIALPLVSAGVGAWAAYFYTVHHERTKIEKSKFDASNNWLLKAEACLQNLISIKRNYSNKIDGHPLGRSLKFPVIIYDSKSVDVDVSELSFIQMSVSDDKWNNLSRIRMLFSNYNYILTLLEKRNDVVHALHKKIVMDNSDQSFAEVSVDDVVKSIGQLDMVNMFDLTEFIIRLVDDILIELHDFMIYFPKITKPLINHKRVKRYGQQLGYEPENEYIIDMLKRTTKLDSAEYSKITGIVVEDIEARLVTGYED